MNIKVIKYIENILINGKNVKDINSDSIYT